MAAPFGAFSIQDALNSLSTSIPEWNQKLDELNSQIALRQIELARIGTENDRPSTQSLKNKGSTESLRPRDGEEEDVDFDIPQSFDPSPKSNTNDPTSNPNTQSPACVTNPLSNHRLSHIEMSRKPSVNKPIQSRVGQRKRKTESMASAESQTPKYRTRSMIIVYYDSAVQTAFEDLVKFVSASRNSMRKGKMNAKMEAMRRAAEKEVEDEPEEDRLIPSNRALEKEQKSGSARAQASNVISGTAVPAMEIGDADSEEVDLTPMKFASTRNRGPPMGYGIRSRMGAGMMGNARSAAGSYGVNDIFDDLDKGLEWCQGQCERAAHQFLRDGDCNDEIEGIKKRFLTVKKEAEQEMEKLKKEEALNPPTPRRDMTKSREMRPPQMRKAINKKPEVAEQKIEQSQLEVDKMEVDDDEGYEDVELPPVMSYRRTRDMGRS